MGKKTSSNNSGNPDRKAEKSGQRSKSTIMRLQMLNSGKAIRNKEGKVVGGYLMMDNTAGNVKIKGQARIAPDRRWFGNTRVISQNELDNLRDKVTAQSNDPYSFILRRKKIPMALLQDSTKVAKLNILETESFDSVFSKQTQRKKPRLSNPAITDYASYAASVEKSEEAHNFKLTNPLEAANSSDLYSGNGSSAASYAASSAADNKLLLDPDNNDGAVMATRDDLFAKGQSKRIWGELYKVLDCSDVILQVLDARDIPGTRSLHIEHHLKKHAPHKQLILLINKCDLLPSWAVRKWTALLSKEYPTIAFHASMHHAFGKGALISLLRQFAKLHSSSDHKRQISVGVIGYPNVGKSSVINCLKGEKCCKTAPIPGETKVWQYVTLTKRIFLIDSPGVVYDKANNGIDEVNTVLKGVVRSERLKDPIDFVQPMLDRLQKEHVCKQYGLAKNTEWENDLDFLTKVAKLKGKLGPNGEADCTTVAKMMINDWQRGKLPYFVPPPRAEQEEDDEDEEEEEGGEEVDGGEEDGAEDEEEGDATDKVKGEGEEDEEEENSVYDSYDEEEEEEGEGGGGDDAEEEA